MSPRMSRSRPRDLAAFRRTGAARLGSLLLTALLGACSSAPPTTFDLSAARPASRSSGSAAQIVVPEPISVQTFESDRIIVKDQAGAVSYLGGGQWADRLPRLIQARLIQTFENASRIKAVSRPGDRIVADYQLNLDIRAFQIDAARGQAVVEVSAKLVSDKAGRIVNARIFSARVPVPRIEAGIAAQALDRALSTVLLDIVRWSGGASPPQV